MLRNTPLFTSLQERLAIYGFSYAGIAKPVGNAVQKLKVFKLKSGEAIEGWVLFESPSYYRIKKRDSSEQIIFKSDLS